MPASGAYKLPSAHKSNGKDIEQWQKVTLEITAWRTVGRLQKKDTSNHGSQDVSQLFHPSPGFQSVNMNRQPILRMQPGPPCYHRRSPLCQWFPPSAVSASQHTQAQVSSSGGFRHTNPKYARERVRRGGGHRSCPTSSTEPYQRHRVEMFWGTI